MADVLRVCAVLVIFAAASAAGLLSAKAFYCRDPDTGKLYPVNATWPSSSFCGSYTCKVRKRNLTEFEYTPLRQLNLTDGDVSVKTTTESPIAKTTTISDSNNAESILNEVKIESMTRENDKSISENYQNEKEIKKMALQKIKDLQAVSENSDRYLTKPEIEAMTELLHSVKKSDLEAILDIYNIAKDIYKEVDKTADENLLEETINDINRNTGNIHKAMGKTNTKPGSTSYWYDPLAVTNNKVKAEEGASFVMPFNAPNPAIKSKDLVYEGSNSIHTAQPIPYFNAFYSDFAKLPYYYPISNFQRQSSYIHQPHSYTPYMNPTEIKKPCQKKEYLSPWNNVLIKQVIEAPKKEVRPQEPVYLPFPFAYVQHYNSSVGDAIKPYFNGNSWTYLNVYNQPQKLNPSYVGAAYIAQMPNAVEHIQDDERKRIEQNKVANKQEKQSVNILDKTSKNKPTKNLEWQTDDLPLSVMDEIRANMVSKSKLFPFSLRKKVKLERVGKVIKIEEHSRSKRETSAEKMTEVYEGYDVYLEKNTCQSDAEPGFFRLGNLTEPYPACCPQRIGTR